MKYFRIGYCPPSPGPYSSPYIGKVRAFNETYIEQSIEYAINNSNLPIYVKTSYGKKYIPITFNTLLKYGQKNYVNI